MENPQVLPRIFLRISVFHFPADFTTLGNSAALSSNVVVSGFHRSNPHRSFSVAGPAPLQILLCRRSCFVDDPSPLSDPSPSSDASPSQSEFSVVQHRSLYRLAFLVLRAFSSTVMSSISSPHSFSQRFGILSFDCEVEPKRDVDAEWIEVSIDRAKALAERLVKLEHLSISSCKLVEEIFVPDEIMSHMAHVHDEIMSHIPHIRKSSHVEMVPIFPNLQTLVISNMDNFKSIWPNQLTQNSFCKLKKMEITSCDQLLNVFPSHVLNKLQSIELWLQPPLEAMVLILLMAQSTGSALSLSMEMLMMSTIMITSIILTRIYFMVLSLVRNELVCLGQ
ncbi:putative disease resistance protein [Trifolium repens]|nr:putative disease resistance protein [Trifolium repens]